MARAGGNADKRRIILDAAIRVFARQGFHSARVSDIAIALGFILVACLAMALPAAWMQRRHGAQQPSDTRDLARDVAQRLGVVNGLILGLVFGQVLGYASQLRD